MLNVLSDFQILTLPATPARALLQQFHQSVQDYLDSGYVILQMPHISKDNQITVFLGLIKEDASTDVWVNSDPERKEEYEKWATYNKMKL